ncbi:MAG TPA: calcium-binding protein [Burkholderiales bacterium]|nr:calcium-binding protein [Burkholderiales bacterium]
MLGDGNANELVGLDGNDTLVGRAGSDSLLGMTGDDTLDGGAGADRLLGDVGFDRASYAGAGAAVLANLAGYTQNTGDAAGDTYSSIEGLIGSPFNDTLVGTDGDNGLEGAAGNDYLQARAGIDILAGGAGSDRLEGGIGGDTLDGGEGFDYAAYYYAATAVTVDLANAAVNGGEAAGDTWSSIEGVAGGAFGDTLYGDLGVNDVIGGNGDDTMFGRAGNDNLQGQDGNDTLDGGLGADWLVGGSGRDTFRFAKGEAHGDTLADLSATGLAGTGDVLEFSGYGTSADGAAFVRIDDTHWQVTAAASFGGQAETLVLTPGYATLVAGVDYAFV